MLGAGEGGSWVRKISLWSWRISCEIGSEISRTWRGDMLRMEEAGERERERERERGRERERERGRERENRSNFMK